MLYDTSMHTVQSPRLSTVTLTLVALAHVGIVAGTVYLRDTTVPVPQPTLMVDIIAPQVMPVQTPKPEPVKAPAEVPHAKPRPQLAPQILAAKHETPSPNVPIVQETPVQPMPAVPAVASETAVPAGPSPTAPPPTPVVSAPRFDAAYLDNPAPTYPPLSRMSGEEGRVVLKVFVTASGTASQVEVRNSSGSDRLDKAAVAAVSRWRFVPAKRGQEAVAAQVLVPIVFSLKD